MKKIIQNISDLIGEEVSSVCFVRDYIEIHFDGPILRILSHPFTLQNDIKYCFPGPGSRDAICRLIGTTVVDVILDDNKSLNIITSDGSELSISLDLKQGHGPEAMHFVPIINGPIQVW